MAVSTKTISTLDQNSGSRTGAHTRQVHYVKVGKNNRKGAAACFGGRLVDHLGHRTGDFHIELTTKVNGKVKDLIITTGDVVFRTGTSNRWQVITKKGFAKRFPNAKI